MSAATARAALGQLYNSGLKPQTLFQGQQFGATTLSAVLEDLPASSLLASVDSGWITLHAGRRKEAQPAKLGAILDEFQTVVIVGRFKQSGMV